jgi:uncharacterized membrane protein
LATLIAIGYPNETTAGAEADEARQLSAAESVIEPDAVAVVTRDKEGRFHIRTTHDPTGGDTPWAMFWGVLFGFLFIPSFTVALETGLAGMIGRLERSCTERRFRDQARDMLQPGTSALFLVASGAPDVAVEAINRHRGTVLESSILEILASVPEAGPDV